MISEKNDENRHQLRGQLPLLIVVVEILRARVRRVGSGGGGASQYTKIPEANTRRADVVTIVKQSVT